MSNAGKTNSNTMSDAATGALPLRQALFQDQKDNGLIVTDGNGVIVDWNAGAERMYGYSREETLGQSLDLIRVPADVTKLTDTMAAVLARDGSWSGDVNFRRKDGSVGVSNTVVFAFIDDDGSPAMIGINRDVSEQRRAQKTEQEAAESLRLITDSLPGHILHVDRDLRYRFVNKGIEELYGQPREYFIGKRVSDVQDPAVYREIAPYFERALDGAEVTFELERTSVDGVRRDYQTTCLPQFDASGEVVGCYVLSVDVTERKRAEATALAAKDEAEHANKAKSEFLANMSHELRTPLNAINGFSEMIFAETLGPLGNVEYQKYAGYIKESGQHLLGLINDLLDISKIEAGSIELADEIVGLAALVRSCVAMIRERADAENVQIHVDIDEELLPLLCADEMRIRQVVLNLLSNAVKFTQAGGEVTVRVWYHVDRGFVLQVADTGIGIAAHNIPKALTRFEQVESTLDRTYEGTGLGLPLTKSLVEEHGGNLDLHSQVGVGTVITVSLPASRAIRPAA
ncbi:MAG: PAS domain-containing sensor histidine kinase [Alphaproteobacteria bacterium]|nr:PAS domain-containing sensor histidine kinase [Alphaproteobacteria bacterium]